jgi:hypothetical protein
MQSQSSSSWSSVLSLFALCHVGSVLLPTDVWCNCLFNLLSIGVIWTGVRLVVMSLSVLTPFITGCLLITRCEIFSCLLKLMSRSDAESMLGVELCCLSECYRKKVLNLLPFLYFSLYCFIHWCYCWFDWHTGLWWMLMNGLMEWSFLRHMLRPPFPLDTCWLRLYSSVS